VSSVPTVDDGGIHVGSEEYASTDRRRCRRGAVRRVELSRRQLLAATGNAAFAAGVTATAGSVPAVAQTSGDWPMYRGAAANTGVVRARPPSEVGTRWTYETDAAIPSAPAVVGDTVYLVDGDGAVHAVDRTAGERTWVTETGTEVVSSPAAVGGTVYVAGDDGRIRALNADGGGVRWTAETDRAVESSPTVVGNTVYVGGNDERVRALDAESGETRWETRVGGAVVGAPAAVDGTVYTATADGELFALEAGSGTVRWERRLFRGVGAPVTVRDGAVFVPTMSDTLLSFEASNGEERWEYAVDMTDATAVVATDDRVLVPSTDDKVYSVDPRTGAQQYRFDAGLRAYDAVGVQGAFGVATGQGVTLVGAESSSERWSVGVGFDGAPSLAAAGSSVFVTTGGGALVRIGPEETQTARQTARRTTRQPDEDQSGGGSTQTEVAPTTPDPGGGGGGVPGDVVSLSVGGVLTAVVVLAYLRRRGDDGDATPEGGSADPFDGDRTSGDATPEGGSADRGPDPAPTSDGARPASDAEQGAPSDRERGAGEVVGTLRAAEDDIDDAVAAFLEGQQVVARVRFRQAKRRLDEALDGLPEEAAVGATVEPETGDAPAELGDVPGLGAASVGTLRGHGYEDLDDVSAASVDEVAGETGIDEDTVARAVVASLGSRGSARTFETTADVGDRRDAAARGQRLCDR
jgi:outer membrane protein assembly factor BamB